MDGDGWALCINSTQSVCEKQAYTDPFGTRAAYSAVELRHVVDFASAR